MIENVNQEKLTAELKRLICHSDWHERYFAEQSRKYHRFDYWLKSGLGLLALCGTVSLANPDLGRIGGFLAGGCAFVLGNVIPNFKWDRIVEGFQKEHETWTRIRQGYEDLLRTSAISDKGEILLQEFQRVREMQTTAALEERNLPKDQALLDKMEAKVRAFYRLDGVPPAE